MNAAHLSQGSWVAPFRKIITRFVTMNLFQVGLCCRTALMPKRRGSVALPISWEGLVSPLSANFATSSNGTGGGTRSTLRLVGKLLSRFREVCDHKRRMHKLLKINETTFYLLDRDIIHRNHALGMNPETCRNNHLGHFSTFSF